MDTLGAWSPVLPDAATLLWLGPLLGAWVLGWGILAGWLKLGRGLRTGDTRKVFHFAIFTTAGILAVGLGLPAVNLLGGLMAVYVVIALWRGEGSVLYEGLARESDAPRRSRYIVVPFLATAAGGILSTALFGPFATVGFVASGWGDAIAEPVGLRIGRRRYRVPNLGGGVRSERSLEGSAAVFLASLAAVLAVLGWAGLPGERSLLEGVGLSLGVAAISTLVEALSPHGLDNLTLQIAASGAAYALA